MTDFNILLCSSN